MIISPDIVEKVAVAKGASVLLGRIRFMVRFGFECLEVCTVKTGVVVFVLALETEIVLAACTEEKRDESEDDDDEDGPTKVRKEFGFGREFEEDGKRSRNDMLFFSFPTNRQLKSCSVRNLSIALDRY